jgi:hypothetical protein
MLHAPHQKEQYHIRYPKSTRGTVTDCKGNRSIATAGIGCLNFAIPSLLEMIKASNQKKKYRIRYP